MFGRATTRQAYACEQVGQRHKNARPSTRWSPSDGHFGDEADVREGAADTASGGDGEIDASAVCKSGEYDNGH